MATIVRYNVDQYTDVQKLCVDIQVKRYADKEQAELLRNYLIAARIIDPATTYQVIIYAETPAIMKIVVLHIYIVILITQI